MNRLSLLDALFLYAETPETPMHIASVTIFKPEPPQDDLFARFREHVAARLDLLPSYRRRLESTPLGIDHPAWVMEDKLDLDYHIRHAALPKPGGMEELRTLIAQLHAIPLDRSRPLWEYHFIEGLEDGGFAVYAKVHHSTMDGIAGMATLGVIYDFAPGAEHESLPERIVPPDVEPSDTIELTSTAIGDFVRQGWRAVTSLPGVARALTKAAPNFGRDARFLYSYVKDMPRTPFNKAISGHRVYATSSLHLHDVRALAKSRGVTINDVVLALCAGALRRYLAEHAALPEKPLTAGVPASLRPIGNAQLNNQVVFTLSRLPTDVAEPLPRLAAAQAAGQEAKSLFADMRDLVTTDVSILGAPLLVTGLVRLWAGARASNYLGPFFNTVISNVPGPRQTMYCVGAPATHYFPVSIPYHGCALNITVHSYLDQLDFGLVACSETVPDAQRIADYIVEDFAAMRKADAELSRPEAIETIAVAARPAVVAAHKPIQLAEPKIEAPAPRPEKASALTRDIEALSAATEALLRKVEQRRSRALQAKPSRLKPHVAEAATRKARPVVRAREEAPAPPSVKQPRKARRARRKGVAPARAGD
ncbi:MAG TPA: wax ester/triacylglycerol synthase family O-acyltransferase [Roseiarcus sp.]|nr:wax ester/triacylglycerol synthase family O-acyltransferase [Roseiarcus sp.]